MATDRELILQWWNDAWREGLWAASWEKSLQGLTPAQAAWQPTGINGSKRHSIWQHVLHMAFWREDALRRLKDPTRPSDETLAKLNFPAITDASEAAWNAARARFAQSQESIRARFEDPASDRSRLAYMIPHDCYHFGQINLIRALQGLPPIE